MSMLGGQYCARSGDLENPDSVGRLARQDLALEDSKAAILQHLTVPGNWLVVSRLEGEISAACSGFLNSGLWRACPCTLVAGISYLGDESVQTGDNRKFWRYAFPQLVFRINLSSDLDDMNSQGRGDIRRSSCNLNSGQCNSLPAGKRPTNMAISYT
jgi:hypothetical protein